MFKKSVVISEEMYSQIKSVMVDIAENENRLEEWIETVKTETWNYAKKSDYWIAKHFLSDLPKRKFDEEMFQEFIKFLRK
jgi:tRNA A37 N6-isopentenylltransferase MiaA